ncbi:MAG: LysM peptidoglycan-binding domain-containing protein [Clostridiales bacterium]|nr:LysM peptidoglycan-binding domain-containing protein [Clostridiales bacterium]
MIIYEIKRGDSLYQIAQFYGTDVDSIARLNNIDPNNTLVIGQALAIPVDNIRYTVVRGDTLYMIARRYGVAVDSIYKANPSLNNRPNIMVGQEIIIPMNDVEPYNVVVNGYMLPGITSSVLQSTLPYLTYLSIFSYEVLPDGDLRPINDSRYVDIARNSGVKPLMTVTNIGGDGFSGDIAHELFVSENATNNFVSNVLDIMAREGYYGLNVDFEYLHPEDRQLYNDFLANLSTVLHQNGYILAVAVAPKTSDNMQGVLYEAHDYMRIGEVSDIVIIMTYEWGYLYGDPQAISPIDKIDQVISYAVTRIPSNKILLGVSNYAYDWQLPYIKGEPARYLSNTQALDLAREKGSTIKFDSRAMSPFFNYYTPTNQHVVWFEDVRTLNAKLQLVDRYNLAGISIWNINYLFNTYGLLENKIME